MGGRVVFAAAVIVIIVNAIYAQDAMIAGVIKPDNACGPRCLSAIMQVTGWGQPTCGVECIYRSLGKTLNSPTNLKELRDLARTFGFSAEVYKWKVSDLRTADGYVILPVGSAEGTEANPLHFILVVGCNDNYITVADGRTLATHDVPRAFLESRWSGYALRIAPGKGMGTPKGEFGPAKRPSTQEAGYDYVEDFGKVNPGAILKHTFIVANSKDIKGQVRIIRKSCTCLSASTTISTDGSILLNMELHVSNAGQQQAAVAIKLGDDGPIKRYALRASAYDSFVLDPAHPHIEAPASGKVEYNIKAEYYSDSDEAISFDHLEVASKGWSVKVVHAIDRNLNPGTFAFDVVLVYDVETGQSQSAWIKDTLYLVFKTKKGPRVVPVTISIDCRRLDAGVLRHESWCSVRPDHFVAMVLLGQGLSRPPASFPLPGSASEQEAGVSD